MATRISRYTRAPILTFGEKYGTSEAIIAIRNGIANGNIRYTDVVLEENERFDTLAGKYYGDGRLYWIICAASEIAFPGQPIPGTLLRIPVLSDVLKVTG